MKITVFTGDQPRHIALVNSLAGIAGQVYAVIEAKIYSGAPATGQPGQSNMMRTYFAAVKAVENNLFGSAPSISGRVHTTILRAGELATMDMNALGPCLNSDRYVVFGSSFIKSPLVDFLISKKAYNLHIGISPYYRGSACNFWACYDKKFDYVGATIHLLSKGLDSGGMLFHALPPVTEDPFLLGMLSVKSAQLGFVECLSHGDIDALEPVMQDKTLQMRYSRIADFNDEVLRSYMAGFPSGKDVAETVRKRDLSRFVRPYIMADMAMKPVGQKKS